jgi:hypothetical protein
VFGQVIGRTDGLEVGQGVVAPVLVAVVDVEPGRDGTDVELVQGTVVELAAAVAVVPVPLVEVPAHTVPVDELRHVAMVSPTLRSRIRTHPRVVHIGCSGVPVNSPPAHVIDTNTRAWW